LLDPIDLFAPWISPSRSDFMRFRIRATPEIAKIISRADPLKSGRVATEATQIEIASRLSITSLSLSLEFYDEVSRRSTHVCRFMAIEKQLVPRKTCSVLSSLLYERDAPWTYVRSLKIQRLCVLRGLRKQAYRVSYLDRIRG